MKIQPVILPTGIQDRQIADTLRAVVSNINMMAKAELVTNAEVMRAIERTVQVVVRSEAVKQASSDTAKAADQVNRVVSDTVLRRIFENSGMSRPLVMTAPVVFQCGTSSTGVGIGAGGIFGANDNVGTFGLDASGGSFFFGRMDAPTKQITFNAATGALTFGSSIVVSGAAMSLGAIADVASDAYSGLSDKLNKSASDILSGIVSISSSAGGFVAGDLTWNSTTGARTGGKGSAMTNKGFLAHNGTTATFSIDLNGNAVFGGAVSAGSYINTDGYVFAYGKSSARTVTIGAANLASAVYGYLGTLGNGSSSPYSAGIVGEVATGSDTAAGVVGYAPGTGGFGVMGYGGAYGVFGGVSNSASAGGWFKNDSGTTGLAVYADGYIYSTGKIRSASTAMSDGDACVTWNAVAGYAMIPPHSTGGALCQYSTDGSSWTNIYLRLQ